VPKEQWLSKAASDALKPKTADDEATTTTTTTTDGGEMHASATTNSGKRPMASGTAETKV
jgi:hypothetical protein